MKRKKSLCIPVVLAVIILVCSGVFSLVKPYEDSGDHNKTRTGKFISHYIDVGQGDSEFIEFPDGKSMLIDAGTDKYGENVINYIKNLGYSKIDYIVGTHPHSDHIGGMADVVNAFDIGSIYMPKASTNTETFENLLLTVQNKGMTINTAKAGISIAVSEDYGYSADILAPIDNEYDDLNNYSVVIKITYGDNKWVMLKKSQKKNCSTAILI